MSTSFYVYDSLELYKKIYGEHRKDPMREIKLIDLYTKKNKLLVVTNTSMHKEQPRMERTIIHFRNGDLGKWEDGTEKLVKFGSIRFNPKKEQLEIFPKFLRKPELSFRIGRHYGETTKKTEVDYVYRFYDLFMDRINLILEKNYA
jgi:hypothetical protein|tara:strand:+ start:557 stop:994 length:438 start_codon:yes stop_codon:yes gene_type:complete